MPDGKQGCANCPHPLAEHAEIEGLENRGHCKVPGCPCGAYSTPSAEQVQSEQVGVAFNTIIARATNADGSLGIEMRVPRGDGRPIDAPQEVFDSIMVEVRGQFENVFGETPAHAGVSALPYLASADKALAELNTPLIQFDKDATAEDAVEALAEFDKLDLPPEAMKFPPKIALGYALREIDAELTFSALKGEFADPQAQEELAQKLAQMPENPNAYLLAQRIQQGDFKDG